MSSLPALEPMLISLFCKSLGPRKWNLLNYLCLAHVMWGSLDCSLISRSRVVIAKMSTCNAGVVLVESERIEISLCGWGASWGEDRKRHSSKSGSEV